MSTSAIVTASGTEHKTILLLDALTRPLLSPCNPSVGGHRLQYLTALSKTVSPSGGPSG
jgi:hypothetical protein